MTDTPESMQLLFEFAQDLTKKDKLKKATAKQLDRLLATYRNISDKEIQNFLIKLEPELKSKFRKEYLEYKRTGYKRYLHGVKAYTIEDLSPEYRKQVQNAVDNSIALIKTQKKEFIEVVQNRIRNWATIPTPETRGEIPGEKKPIETVFNQLIKSTPSRYDTDEHRDMILRDQSRKLVSAMNSITANSAGAIGFIWHNRRDNRVVGRPGGLWPKPSKLHGNHWNREGVFYILSDSWAIKRGLLKKTKGIIFDINIPDGIPGTAPDCRCYAEYIFILSDIPKKYTDCITKKGHEYMDEMES